jgi:predicted nucleic acid-binding protein
VLLLDADVLIDIQRGHSPAVEWFTGLSEPPSVPGLVVMELIQDAQNRQQVERAQKLVAPLPVVWPTEADCDLALDLFGQFHLSHNLGLLDALIGSTAVGLGAALCTFNVKHFRVIQDLVVEEPYPRK